MGSSTRSGGRGRALPAGGIQQTRSGPVNLAGATGPTPQAQAEYNAQLQALRAPMTTAGAEGPGVPGVAVGGPPLPPPMIMPTHAGSRWPVDA